MLKRIITTCLVGVILVCSVGHYPIYWVKRSNVRSAIKHRIKNSIPEDELHLIIFNAEEDINWTREGKEFKMGEYMYDIVHDVSTDEKVRLMCVNDVEEAILFADLDALVNRNLGGDKSPLSSKGKLMLKLVSFYEEWEETNLESNIETHQQHVFQERSLFFDGLYQNVPSPPPQLAA